MKYLRKIISDTGFDEINYGLSNDLSFLKNETSLK